MSQDLNKLDNDFQTFLRTNVLSSYHAQSMDGKAKYIVRKLYEAFRDTPSQLPDTAISSIYYLARNDKNYKRNETLRLIDANYNVTILHRCIADYIGGMTDGFAYNEFDRLYGTRV